MPVIIGNMPVRPTRSGRAGLLWSETDSRRDPECIRTGICNCRWGCVPFRTAWVDRIPDTPECLLAGVCSCGWRCEPIQLIPSLNDALQLRTLWNASAELLTQRLLHLDLLSERLDTNPDALLAHLGTVEQWMSFIQYLAIERNAAWVRYDLEHKAV
jgi:hypothetical protein